MQILGTILIQVSSTCMMFYLRLHGVVVVALDVLSPGEYESGVQRNQIVFVGNVHLPQTRAVGERWTCQGGADGHEAEWTAIYWRGNFPVQKQELSMYEWLGKAAWRWKGWPCSRYERSHKMGPALNWLKVCLSFEL